MIRIVDIGDMYNNHIVDTADIYSIYIMDTNNM
jgi:hypothetical protein